MTSLESSARGAGNPRRALWPLPAALALVAGCGGSDSAVGQREAASKSADERRPRSRCGRGPPRRRQTQRLVKAYNAGHKNQVELTVIPTDNYQARVAAAAGGKKLPDVLRLGRHLRARTTRPRGSISTSPTRSTSSRSRTTSRRRTWSSARSTTRSTPSPTRSTSRCCSGTRTSTRRPASIPRSRRRHSRSSPSRPATIRKKLGGNDYGTFFGGNCPGCYVFTFWPSVWAAGGDGHERGRHE